MKKPQRISIYLKHSARDSLFSAFEGRELSKLLDEPSISIRHIRNEANWLLKSKIAVNGFLDNWFLPLNRLLDKAIERKATDAQVLFSPGKKIRARIVELIKQSQHSIMVCVYTFSEQKFADALL